MIDKATSNARKPKNNLYENILLEIMNIHHKALTTWALEHISEDDIKNGKVHLSVENVAE